MSGGERFRDQRRWALHTLRDFGFGRSTIEDTIREELIDFCRVLGSQTTSAVKDKSLGTMHAATSIDPAMALTRSVCNVICNVLFGARLGDDPEIGLLLERLDFILRFQVNRPFVLFFAEYATH